MTRQKRLKNDGHKSQHVNLYLINHFTYFKKHFFFLDLLEEYLTWLPQTAHKEVRSIWPPL